MKIIYRLVIALIWISFIGFLASCRASKIPEVVSTIRKDSTITIIKEVPIPVPGATVYKKLNIDSLRALFGSGKIERYYQTADKEGLNTLTTKIDLLTGQMTQECETRDSIIYAQNKTIERLQYEKSVVKEPVKKPGFWERLWLKGKGWINTALLLGAIVLAVLYILKRLGKSIL